MDDFWTVVSALFYGLASGPVGLFIGGLILGSLAIVAYMTIQSKEDDR